MVRRKAYALERVTEASEVGANLRQNVVMEARDGRELSVSIFQVGSVK